MKEVTHRAATMRSQSFDATARTIDIVWTTGATVRRYDFWEGTEYDETLSLAPGAVRLGRLNAGAPFLDSHRSDGLANVIGSVVPGSAVVDGTKGLATIKLSAASCDADTVQKIADGVVRNVSVGYWIHEQRETTGTGAVPTRLVTDWEPLEISAVPVPADAAAQIRSYDRRQAAGPQRVAEIRRMARRVGLPALGETHARLGTSAAQFFVIAAREVEKTPAQRAFEAGAAAAAALVAGRTRSDSTRQAGAREARRLLGTR